jgi:hypothetical protein
VDEGGVTIEIQDPLASELTAAARMLLNYPEDPSMIVTKFGMADPEDGAVLPFVVLPVRSGLEGVSGFLRTAGLGNELASDTTIVAAVHDALTLLLASGSTRSLLNSVVSSHMEKEAHAHTYIE